MTTDDKKQFVLNSKSYNLGNVSHWDGYYTGKTYVFQGEVYAVCDTDINEAKKYSSVKQAESAVKSCNERICNYTFVVKEI